MTSKTKRSKSKSKTRIRAESAAPSAPPELGDELARRVWIQNVRPSVDGGAFPIQRTVGEKVEVTADVFADGHDALAVMLCWKPQSSRQWKYVPMFPRPNDVWRAEFTVEEARHYEYTVLAWIDHFATWREALIKKAEAGQDVASELLEGAAMVEAAAERAEKAGGDEAPGRDRLRSVAERLRAKEPQADRVACAVEKELSDWMARWDARDRATATERVYEVEVARERARFSAWYELFPRSAGEKPGAGGTLRDAARRLPEIAAMGFDVVYLPPIHPIGRAHRKGPNNTADAGPKDPGSPWAIGAAEGGHEAIHPDLGGLDDFEHLLKTAGEHGLEIALDIAFQCSPDHPWVRQHPEWFRHRPDGTIKYAENPPKKYQDIYPLDFDCAEWRSLWQALHDVVQLWVDRGVRIFRVDNPHTKPLRFWGWLIGEIKSRHPDAIFLAEAFTRPKVMYTLAKVGFDQSYTYFTWRNTSSELKEYLTELTRTEVREFFRPNLWPNTPDILPEYLQFGGRPAFQTRLVLAATLAANYGCYSGYELCEAEALEGREEYRDSEKFEIKHRDWKQPGNLRDYIARVNRIRRENPALAYDHRLQFHPSDNDQILFYSKVTDDLSNIILVAVNLDPHHAHDGWVELPLVELGLDPEQSFQVHDLLGEGRYLWQGSRNYVRLDPTASPAQIFRVRRRLRTERDFDYFG